MLDVETFLSGLYVVVDDRVKQVRRPQQVTAPRVGRPADGYSVGGSGFDRPATLQVWQQVYGVRMVSMPYRNQRRWPRALRQIVETVRDRLLHTFDQAHRRPHTLVGALGGGGGAAQRPLLAIADLLAWQTFPTKR